MKSRARLLLGVLLVAAGCAGAGAQSAAPPPGASTGDDPSAGVSDDEGAGDEQSLQPPPAARRGELLAEAARELSAMRSSRYTHRTDVDEDAGRFDYDCSGFVSYAIACADPNAYRAIRAFAARRPLAKDYVAWILLAGSHPSSSWIRVPDVARLAPGDVIAWLKPPSIASRHTGHAMIVGGPPRLRSPGEWVVPIVDSTARAHGIGDRRASMHSTGLGRAAIVLVTDGAGMPVAYRWSEAESSRVFATSIVLARVGADQGAR
jgi:hypothetical protein